MNTIRYNKIQFIYDKFRMSRNLQRLQRSDEE